MYFTLGFLHGMTDASVISKDFISYFRSAFSALQSQKKKDRHETLLRSASVLDGCRTRIRTQTNRVRAVSYTHLDVYKRQPLAYREKKRLSFLEGNYGMGENCNMGEVFPGRMDGCMTEKLAFVLLEEIKKVAAAVVDFHCWGYGQESKPYTVIKKYPDEKISREIFAIAKAFGSKMICTLDLTRKLDEPSPVDRQMDVLCAEAGIPSFMAETGHSERAEPEYIDFAVQGAINVMKYYGCLLYTSSRSSRAQPSEAT